MIKSTKLVTLSHEFCHLINYHGIDSDLNTPDFILADYLVQCLRNSEKLCGGTSEEATTVRNT